MLEDLTITLVGTLHQVVREKELSFPIRAAVVAAGEDYLLATFDADKDGNVSIRDVSGDTARALAYPVEILFHDADGKLAVAHFETEKSDVSLN